ncbi:hypothetical protein OG21DRAFT_519611 [Imleria badia]|nr:hypothetical protein OG21DRAFT_519611 [Imleria badia]
MPFRLPPVAALDWYSIRRFPQHSTTTIRTKYALCFASPNSPVCSICPPPSAGTRLSPHIDEDPAALSPPAPKRTLQTPARPIGPSPGLRTRSNAEDLVALTTVCKPLRENLLNNPGIWRKLYTRSTRFLLRDSSTGKLPPTFSYERKDFIQCGRRRRVTSRFSTLPF